MHLKDKILVTGVNGFVGHHVAKQLHNSGYFVVGASNQVKLENDLVGTVDEYISCDLTNSEDVSKINLSEIIAIINLAGFAKVGDSRGQGELYNRVNVGVHTVLYEECLKQNAQPRIIAISTGAVYDPNQPLPITEESLLIDDSKTNEYVISKKLAEQAIAAFNNKGLKCIIVRPFNHSGPGQLPGFLLPDLGEQLDSAVSKSEPLKVGNLETRRDYTDVRDVARAYVELATCPDDNLKYSIYNICSGKSTSGKDILNFMAKASGVENLSTETDPERIRPNEVMDIYGSHDRLTEATEWQPSISVEQMVKDFVVWKKSGDVEKS
ncbi:MAG: NAD(P)-dependent oxidoreductase [Candidatus Saccharibacteria bacterium]|nr:NAD(P)-dependent oxidoreductase [Candidatus Saccharibacteria bacterium]